jgi:hypothetical protein
MKIIHRSPSLICIIANLIKQVKAIVLERDHHEHLPEFVEIIFEFNILFWYLYRSGHLQQVLLIKLLFVSFLESLRNIFNSFFGALFEAARGCLSFILLLLKMRQNQLSVFNIVNMKIMPLVIPIWCWHFPTSYRQRGSMQNIKCELC